MIKRIAPIAFIFVCTAAAWALLGATILARTSSFDPTLKARVASTWGAPHEQAPPSATHEQLIPKTVESGEQGKEIVPTLAERVVIPLPLESSQVEVALDVEHRQKGLLWYGTYKVTFGGLYAFRNTSDRPQAVTFALKLPAVQATYDDLVLLADGAPLALTTDKTEVKGTMEVAAGRTAVLRVAYRSQGLDSWHYRLGQGVAKVGQLTLKMVTNFKDIDFPDSTLSPQEKRQTARGWELVWRYANLLSGAQIGMTMPEKLQPGPLAGRISFFAPVSLLFFFFLLFIVTTLRGIEMHPMNYFFLAAAFFAFHLLLAYLVDHISIHTAFLISSAVSVFLVVSYLRLVVGMRFAAVEAGLAQLVYLVLFSYAFFFRGFTGLAITIGSIVTLFLVMQMTGRIRWAERFAGGPARE